MNKYKLTLKNYILTTLLLISILLLLCECTNIIELIIIKFLAITYISCLTYANIIRQPIQ